ncbi:hypothetical protein [Alteribacter populi]|uniref:hypothetical protein n=1 Tax=Alteribacter populi TaxID=2011011 RepID=UPI000BBB5C36|nr:hypothetical protein [Alteribacter populi]
MLFVALVVAFSYQFPALYDGHSTIGGLLIIFVCFIGIIVVPFFQARKYLITNGPEQETMDLLDAKIKEYELPFDMKKTDFDMRNTVYQVPDTNIKIVASWNQSSFNNDYETNVRLKLKNVNQLDRAKEALDDCFDELIEIRRDCSFKKRLTSYLFLYVLLIGVGFSLIMMS